MDGLHLQSLMIFVAKKYSHIIQSWSNNQNELSTFFKYPKLIYTTNPIESLNSSIKRRIKPKGSFPTIESEFKCSIFQHKRYKINQIKTL